VTRAAALRRESGQALLLLLGALLAVLVGAVILGGVARGLDVRADHQRAADLAALAGARSMRAAYARLFEPPRLGGRPNPRHLEAATYLALARSAAAATAHRNGARAVHVDFPSADGFAPTRISVTVTDSVRVIDRALDDRRAATAELVPPGALPPGDAPVRDGEYPGPFATRQGRRMRPDVALAFDRLAAAARADGVDLVIVSAFRSDAEQAALFAAHPDPRWVAPPGQSLHRLGTELDLGPAAAYGWLRTHAPHFDFVARYPWEPWHWGYSLTPASSGVGYGSGARGDGPAGAALPAFVPPAIAPAISRAAQRWSVSAALLAAQLWRESGFNPFVVSGAGAQGIAQLMPATAHRYGVDDPFDSDEAIDAQAHLMRDLLRRFAAVPLALAAYNAGPAPVAACWCVPAIPETVQYVADILGLLHGAGDPAGAGAGALEVRLVQ
jgi:hypothetical protein